ncbi:hypothetical protein [Micromonospora rubida]
MHSLAANGNSRLSCWLRVRKFAVPPSMIKSATARRVAGDWAGACAAARVDVDLNLRAVARTHGHELAARVRADLRRLAPDLLRWHLPRVAPDGLLRPGLTISLARYHPAGPEDGRAVHLVARTPPAWAEAGQRISLTLWAGLRSEAGRGPHPHPRPDRRFRLDLHRHLWDTRRAGELRVRSGADRPPTAGPLEAVRVETDLGMPQEHDCAVHRWVAEAELLLRAEGRPPGPVAVRLGARRRLVLNLPTNGDATGQPALRIVATAVHGCATPMPVLPDAATWVLPDLTLLRAGLVEADDLHPLVASALVPDHQAAGAGRPGSDGAVPRLVECRGAQHRIGLVDGILVPLDHDPTEIRREELLAALTGTPMPCLRAIDEAHRNPESLDTVRAHLDHGDTAGALAAVEGLLGPGALLRDGALREELETAALRRVAYGLFRTGLAGSGPGPANRPPGHRPRHHRAHPRHAVAG